MATYVRPVSSASKTGSHPKLGGPRAGTILPSVRPSKRTGSVPGPALYANVQSAHAARVGKPSSIRLRPELGHPEVIEVCVRTREGRGIQYSMGFISQRIDRD